MNIINSGVNQGDGITKTIYAFGKDGVKRLDSSRNLNKNHINVNIPPQYYYHFTDDIKRTLDLLEIEHVAYLSCPEGKYEAFVIPGADVLIGSFNASESSERTINLSIDAPLVKERSRVLSELEEAAKEEAIRHFRLASELHFRLEKIYVNSMNFDKLDSFYNETLEKIKKNLY